MANMVKVEDNFSDSNETEVYFQSIQTDIKLETEDEILLDIKQEELDIKDEVPTTSTFQSDGDQDFDGSVPSISFQKSNQKHVGIVDDFKTIGSNIKLETEDEILLDIKQEVVDIKDEFPSTSTFQNGGDQDVDDNAPSVCSQKPNHKFVSSYTTHREKLFVCNVCNYKSARKSYLAIHMRCHTGEKPFVYDLCNFKSARKDSLTIHIMTSHTGEKRFASDLCDFKSAHKFHLTSHMRRHTGEKPFACGLCDFKSAHKFHSTSHMRRHTGEKPFACGLCDFKSAHKFHLTSHMRRHTGDKPFTCDLCNFKCARKDCLTIHMASHTGEKRFACGLCDYKSARKADLVKHMKRHLQHR